MIFVWGDIPSRFIVPSPLTYGTESLFIEINLRNRRWLSSGIYIPRTTLAPLHLEKIGYTLDLYLKKYEYFLVMGDFNAEDGEEAMQIFCDTYDFKNLVNVPTCYKNPNNPSCIDLILTNKAKSFCNTLVIETGHHKMTVTVTKSYLPKTKPKSVICRCYKTFVVDTLNMI